MPLSVLKMDCKERISGLTSAVAKEKKSFQESLTRFQEKGKALKVALETARASASGNVNTLKEKHQASDFSRSIVRGSPRRSSGVLYLPC